MYLSPSAHPLFLVPFIPPPESRRARGKLLSSSLHFLSSSFSAAVSISSSAPSTLLLPTPSRARITSSPLTSGKNLAETEVEIGGGEAYDFRGLRLLLFGAVGLIGGFSFGRPNQWFSGLKMDLNSRSIAELLTKIEAEADEFLLARSQIVENDKDRNANREALTALRKRAHTTKTSVASPFESIMKDIGGNTSKPLVKEVCSTCGNHDSSEPTWMMFPGADLFAAVPFHAVHTILEKDQERLEFESNKLQSFVKEKALFISELGALADKSSPGIIRSLVTLTDKPK